MEPVFGLWSLVLTQLQSAQLGRVASSQIIACHASLLRPLEFLAFDLLPDVGALLEIFRMSSLWKVDDQVERLVELTSHDAELKEAPLRRDVRSLGRVLGEVLKEQVGEEFYSAVEELRLLLIEHRESKPTPAPPEDLDSQHQLIERAEEIVSRLSVQQAHQMTKAFAIYFELTNLAETNHRKRRRRAAQASAEPRAQPGSFLGTLRRMRDAGIEETKALEWLSQIEVILVFTAHPTEVARRTVLFKRQRIASELEKLDQLPLTEREAEET